MTSYGEEPIPADEDTGFQSYQPWCGLGYENG